MRYPCMNMYKAYAWTHAKIHTDPYRNRLSIHTLRKRIDTCYKNIVVHTGISAYRSQIIMTYMTFLLAFICVSMYLYAYIHQCIVGSIIHHTNECVGMHVCLYVCMSICLSVYLSICLHACINICLYVCMHVCTCVCM